MCHSETYVHTRALRDTFSSFSKYMILRQQLKCNVLHKTKHQGDLKVLEAGHCNEIADTPRMHL